MRYRALRRDETHAGIVRDLLAIGFSVADTSGVGNDFPDLVIAYQGFTALVECKTRYTDRSEEAARRIPAYHRLTDGQRVFAQGWKGLCMVEYDAEAIALAFNARRRAYNRARFGSKQIERTSIYGLQCPKCGHLIEGRATRVE